MSRVHAKYRGMVAGTDVPASSAAVQASGPAHDHGTAGHVVPLWLLAAVLAVLLFLTVVTVAVTYVDLGAANIFVALFIAVVKAALVLLYFMHLRWDSPFNSLVIISALLFVAVFLAFAMIDTAEYRPVVDDAVRTMMSR